MLQTTAEELETRNKDRYVYQDVQAEESKQKLNNRVKQQKKDIVVYKYAYFDNTSNKGKRDTIARHMHPLNYLPDFPGAKAIQATGNFSGCLLWEQARDNEGQVSRPKAMNYVEKESCARFNNDRQFWQYQM